MAKKRNKKHNPMRWAELATKGALNGLALVYVANGANTNDVLLTDLTGYQVEFKKSIYDAVSDFKHKWIVNLVIGCHDSRGNKEVKISDFVCDQPYYQSDLPEHLNHTHQEFLKDVQSKNTQINYAGWIARASGRELDQKEIFNIFEKLGAWS